MKKISLFIFLLLLIPISIKAEEIDINKIGSINIIYKYGTTSITNSDIYIYKVANINTSGKYTYLDSFNLTDDLNNTSASKLNDLAITINNYIKDNNINNTNTCKTNSEGICKIDNLSTGVYLITTEEVTIDNYKYTVSPNLISIPTQNEIDDNYIYDIDAILKTEAKSIKDDTSNTSKNDTSTTGTSKTNASKNNTAVPLTIDNIYIYATIFIVSIIVVVLIVLYINKLRKKNINNEKNN